MEIIVDGPCVGFTNDHFYFAKLEYYKIKFVVQASQDHKLMGT